MVKKQIWSYEEISNPHIKLLQWIGFIPFEGKTLNFPGTKLIILYCHFMMLSYNLMYLGYGVKMAVLKKFEIDYISEQIIVENIFIRFIILYGNRKELVKLLVKCKELWLYVRADESGIVREYERKAYYFWIIIMFNVFAMVTVFLLSAQFVIRPTNIVNGTAMRILPFRFFVDIHEGPLFTIMYIYQSIVNYSIGIINTGMEAASFYLILLACGYLRVVRTRLISIIERQEKIKQQETQKEIASIYNEILICVKFHQNIMTYCEGIERFMQNVYFVGVFTSVYNISMLGLSLLQKNEEFVKFAGLILMNLFQFFTYQWSPENLLQESKSIANAAYSSSFNKIDHRQKTNKLLYFLILRAQKPIQLTAGGYLKLSMETFGTMIKGSFSSFAVLRNFSN